MRSFGADPLADFKFRMYQEFAVRDPRAHVKVTGPVGDSLPLSEPTLFGLRVIESDLISENMILVTNGYPLDADGKLRENAVGKILLSPYNRYGERTGVERLKRVPGWTRHMLGVQEAARDRRRRRKR